MDKGKAIELAKQYKSLVSKDFTEAKIYLYGSYSKGTARPDSDIDIAVVVPRVDGDWWEKTVRLWRMTHRVSTLIEPVIIEECHPSPLYEDVKRTGIRI